MSIEALSPFPDLTVATSVANNFNRATAPVLFTWGLADHVEVANHAGVDGVEVWPQRGRVRHDLYRSNLPQTVKDKVLTVHQSARENKFTGREVLKGIILPERVNSLAHLDQARQVFGDIPAVLFEQTPSEYHEQSGFTWRGIQPQPELYEAWKVDSPELLREKAFEIGFTHTIIDTFHLTRPEKNTGQPQAISWQKAVDVFLPGSPEIQIGIGRSDYKGVDEAETRADALNLLYGGTENTLTVQMLRYIAETGWKGLIVIELRLAIFNKELEAVFGFGTPWHLKKNLATMYEGIRETIYNIFGE